MKRILLTLTGATALAASCWSSAIAETPDHASLVPADAAWGMVFDLSKLGDSTLAKQTAAHLDPAQLEGMNDKLDGLSNMLGINLRQDLGRVVAFGHGFAPQDMAMAIDIGQAEANLEGLMLAAEGYDSYDYQDLIIHSLQNNPDEPRMYSAILPAALSPAEGQTGVVLISPAAELTEKLVDQVQAGAAVSDPASLKANEFVRVWIDRLPTEIFGQGSPQSNVVSMIQSLELVGSTDAEQTAMNLSLTTANPARARQIYQMASGGKAFVEFAAASDPDAERLADLLAYISIDNPDGGAVVSIRAFANTDDFALLIDLLEEQGLFDKLAE